MTTSNTYGRAVDVPMVNKSGGGVVLGDVVIYDTTNNDAFTTTTSAGSTLACGVAQETIASNATGRIRTLGYTSLVNVNASVTRGHYGYTHTVAKQATDAGAARLAGTFLYFMTGGTTPDAIIYPVDLAGAALTNPMSHVGAVIIGGSAGAPTELVIGAAGGALSSLNGTAAYNSGTSFPGSKATGDRYWRTDLGMEFYYDGTNWLSTGLYPLLVGTSDVLNGYTTGPGTQRGAAPVWSGSDIWLASTQTWFFINAGTALDASNKWVGTLVKQPAGTTLDTVNIASGASSTYRQSTATAINALLTSSTQFAFVMSWAKTGTPGPLFTQTVISFRYVAV